ncbi:MAG: hypothetical protein RLZZ450_3212 [Pseudomonadota bacterium]|jgi:hypothetical protein
MSNARLLVASVVFALLVAGSDRAEAQACHTIEFRKPDKGRFRATVGLLAATYGSGDDAGDYQGVYTGFGYRADWYGAEVLLPAYHLSRSAGTEYGLGDLVVTARGTGIRAREGAITAGVELPVMFPTGDAQRELGMGRVMPMPGLWFAFVRAPFTVRMQAGYGHMIGTEKAAEEHHHHEASAAPMRHPIVNPMNRSEFEHGLTLGLGLSRTMSVHARWFGAVPVADDHGVVREILAAGATASMAAFDVTLEGQKPVAGDPFDYRLVLQLGASF